MGPVALVVGAVATVAGVGLNLAGQKKAARASRRAARAQQAQQEQASRQSRRQAIRSSQLIRAQSTASAQGSGTLQSSGFSGGVGSLSSQLGTQIGFASQQTALSRDITRFGIQESKGLQLANFGSGLQSIGGQLVGFGQNQGATFSGLLPKKKGTVA